LSSIFLIVFLGSLFGNSATTFGQQQTTEGFGSFGQKEGSLFSSPTSCTTGTGFGSGFNTTTSIFKQSSSGQMVYVYCFLPHIPYISAAT